MRKINIGITINIENPTESFFSNGLKQNAITFLETFSACRNVEKVYLINLGSQKDLSKSPWKKFEDKIINFNECLDKIDLAVTVIVSFTDDMLTALHAKGIRIVKHVLGTEYHSLTESVLFNKPNNTSFKKRKNHSAVWISPHIYPSNKDLFEIICNAPAYVAPFVWSPSFLESHVEECKVTIKTSGFYETRESAKKISVFEPNINIVKTCITPIITGEKMYHKRPDLIKKVSIFGSGEIKKSKTLIEFAKNLDIYKNKKMFFEDRYRIAWSLLSHTDIVLSHQRDLALNYLYFDAAWLGFPVVHNAHLVKDLGYYYEGFDAEEAANILVEVATNFDNQKDEYLKKSREYISKFLPTNEFNVQGYEQLIEKAMSYNAKT